MADKNIDENMFDEKVIAKRIAEEEDLLTRLQMDIAERQERKKKLAANIRSLTHKIKALEEDITKDALVADALKRDKEKFITRVDARLVNKKIDKKCDEIYAGLLQTVNPNEMKIEVDFEEHRTTFTVSDHKINSHYDRETQDDEEGTPKGSAREGSFLSFDSHAANKFKKAFKCRTFGEMKEDVAPFFSLSPDNFFFADAQDVVYLDILEIRPTLFPFGQKITNTAPRLRIMLTNNLKYDDMIAERIKEEIGEVEVVDNTKLKAEQKEVYENEQARKKADQKRKSALEYYQFKKKVYKWKGFVSSLLYVVLIVLWLYNVLSNYEFDQTFLMRNTTETAFESYASAINTATFYQQLSDQLQNTNSGDQAYGFVHFNYVMPGAEVVCKRYKHIDCKLSTNYMNKYYPPVNGTCTDPTKIDKDPFEANGVTYYYDGDSNKKVNLPLLEGSFDNEGYRLPVDFNDPDMDTKIANFVDAFVAEFVSLSFVFYNPSIQKMACAYRIVYRYNRDKTTIESFSYIFNVRKQSTASVVIEDMILVIAALLVLNSIFDLIDFVPASKTDLDLDLVWLRKSRKGTIKEEEALRHRPKFKMLQLGGMVFKFYLPSPVNLFNLLSVVLNIWVVALDIARYRSINAIDFTTGAGINCPSLISHKTTTDILYVIIIMLMMIVLLRYISQFVPFLHHFIMIIKNILRNTSSLGFLILWLLVTIALFGIYTFGAFFPNFDTFGYMYASLVLLLMKKNVLMESYDQSAYYTRMNNNIGAGALIGMMIFSYIVFSYLIIKIITSIVIKSIKEAEGTERTEEIEEEKRKEESLALIREKFYEEFRLSQSKQRAKPLNEAAKQTEGKEKDKKKKK